MSTSPPSLLNQAQIQKLQNSNKWKIWVAIGVAAFISGAFFYYRYRNRHPDQSKIYELKKLIDKSFQNAQSSLCPLIPQKTKTIKDDLISLDVHFISKLQDKTRTTLSSTRNPFLPPFEKGMMVAELPPRHRLIYNKFYILKNHLLVVTQQFQQQTRITLQDMKQTLFVMEALNGLFFFNSGPQSGFSQKHKHMQVLPASAFKLPIVAQILLDIKNNDLEKVNYKNKQNIAIHLFKGYQFIHGVVIMPPNMKQDNLEQAAIQFKMAQDVLWNYLTRVLRNQTISFNVIGCNKFIAMIPRKAQKVMNQIGVNAICFMGSILVKDQKTYERIQHLYKPTDLLRQLTFTTLPGPI